MKFRYDINALRALAVTAVVLYHYKVNFIPGGFVGVDVFFVISGYLMTTIITERLARGSFGIWNFYNERARRIIPGLLGLCFGLLAAGYFVLEPGAYQILGSEAIGALLFVSNSSFGKARVISIRKASTNGFCIAEAFQWNGSSTCFIQSFCFACTPQG